MARRIRKRQEAQEAKSNGTTTTSPASASATTTTVAANPSPQKRARTDNLLPPPGTYDAATEAKLAQWAAAKRKKDYATADSIRAELRNGGVDPDRIGKDVSTGAALVQSLLKQPAAAAAPTVHPPSSLAPVAPVAPVAPAAPAALAAPAAPAAPTAVGLAPRRHQAPSRSTDALTAVRSS